jgi:hypothetical protein
MCPVCSPEHCPHWLSMTGFSKYCQLPTLINILNIINKGVCIKVLIGDFLERANLERRFYTLREELKFVV